MPISVLTPVKLETKQCQLKLCLRRATTYLMRAEPNEVKFLHFLLVFVNDDFKDQSLIEKIKNT